MWEHYTPEWKVDWDYNRDDPKHLFRPYGYLPGHMTEWAKLLLVLERHRPKDWMLPCAVHHYATAIANSADLKFGGMHYSYGSGGRLYDLDKYHWVHCETIAAAAALAARTGQERYWQDYDRLWSYSWRHLIDRERGCWYRVASPDGRKYDDLKSSAGEDRLSSAGRVLGNPARHGLRQRPVLTAPTVRPTAVSRCRRTCRLPSGGDPCGRQERGHFSIPHCTIPSACAQCRHGSELRSPSWSSTKTASAPRSSRRGCARPAMTA